MLCWVYVVDGVLVGRCAASAATTWAPSMKEVKRKGGCVWWITIIGNSAQLCWRHSQVGFCCWGRLPLRREWWQTAEPYWGPWLNNRRVSAGGGVKVWVRIPLGLKNTQTRINFTRFPCCDGIWTRDSLTEGRGANHITTLTCYSLLTKEIFWILCQLIKFVAVLSSGNLCLINHLILFWPHAASTASNTNCQNALGFFWVKEGQKQKC